MVDMNPRHVYQIFALEEKTVAKKSISHTKHP